MSGAAKRRQRGVRLRWGVGRLLALVTFTVVMTSVGLYQVHRHYQLVQVGYAIDQDLFEYRRLRETRKRLELELSAFKAPGTVREFAEKSLHMRRPSAQDELRIPDPGQRAPQREMLTFSDLADPEGGP